MHRFLTTICADLLRVAAVVWRSCWRIAAAGVLTASVLPAGAESQDWFENGRNSLEHAKRVKGINGKARNVILFVGDGMGVSTVTAARILEGQMRGESGEENLLSFERLPYLALSKTYSANQQTPDSAPTMSAMMTGVKTNGGMFGVNDSVARAETRWSKIQNNRLVTLLEIAEMLARPDFNPEFLAEFP